MYQDYVPATNSWQVLSALSAIAGVVIAAIGWTLKIVSSTRDNHLQHMDAKLDVIVRGVEKVEDKIDHHLEWHATEKK